MIRSVLSIACLVILFQLPVYTQVPYAQLESEVFSLISAYQDSAQAVNMDMLERVTAQVENRADTPGLTTFERFTLPYYAGYLHYIAGLIPDKANAERQTSFSTAREWFERAASSYVDSLQMPEQRVYADYMQGWCGLREYSLAPGEQRYPLLQAAITGFGELLNRDYAGFLTEHVRFLRGYSSYLIALSEFHAMRTDSAGLSRAIRDFSRIRMETESLYPLARFFAAGSHYLRAQYSGLHRLRGNSISNAQRDSARSDLQTARTILNNLAISDTLGDPARTGYNLTRIQDHVLQGSPIPPDDLILSDMRSGERLLLRRYAGFLNFLQPGGEPGSVQDNANPELKFWTGVQRYITALTREGDIGSAGTLEALLTGISYQGWRTGHLQALGGLYAMELSVIQGNPRRPETGDQGLLLPSHSKRRAFLGGYLTLREQLSEEGFDIWLMEDVQLLVDNVPEILEQQVQAIFGEDEMIDQWGHYLLTLGQKNESLYPAAYLLFEYLQRQGYQTQKMYLLKAYCEYKLGDSDAVLSLLNQERITGFDRGNEVEAIYFRAMAYRQITGLRFAPEVQSELEKIQEVHPYAGYAIAYEMNPEDIDRELLNIVGTQACGDDRFADLCEAAREIGYDQVPAPPEVVVGDAGVRFEELQDLMDDYLERERRYLMAYWQVFSRPFPELRPAVSALEDCPVIGPREFYLDNTLDVTLSLGADGYRKQIALSTESGECRILETTADEITLETLPLRSYQIQIARDGAYPVIESRKFTADNQSVDLSGGYREAVQIEGESRQAAVASIDALLVDYVDDYYLVEQGDPRALRIRSIRGTNWETLSDAGESYAALTRVGDTYYALESSAKTVMRFTEGGNSLESVRGFAGGPVNRPVDIAGYERYLFVVNAGDNTIARYNVNSGEWRVSSPFSDGRLQSATVIGDRLFVSDWKANVIYSGDVSLGSFQEVSGIDDARADGMIAPGKLSVVEGGLLVVSDPLANALFLFHQSGVYLGTMDHDDFALPGPVRLSEEGARLLIGQENGYRSYPLVSDPTYRFTPQCDTTGAPARLSISGASRFCLPE